MKPWQEFAAAAGLLILFLGLVVGSLRQESVTVDEFAHLPAGYYYWKTGDFSLYSRNPPLVKMIAAAPWLVLRPVWGQAAVDYGDRGWRAWRYGTGFMRANAEQYVNLIFWGRVPVAALGVLLGVMAWRWSRRLYGPLGGIVSLTCFCLCPNLLAHSGLATTDLGASCFIFLAVMGGLHFLERPTWTRGICAGLLLGLAQLAKFSSLFLLPMFLTMPCWAKRWQRWVLREKEPRFTTAGFLLAWALMGLTAWLALSAGYGFEWDPGLFSRWPFVSQAMLRAQKLLPALPVPLPWDYLDGLDLQIRDSEVRIGEFPNYLLGEWYRGQKWDYFPVALLVKMPLPLLLALGASLLSLAGKLRPRAGQALAPRLLPEEAAILVFLACGYLALTWRNHLQIGIRYLLPLFPFAYVLSGRLVALRWPAGWLRPARVAGILLGVWLAVGSVRAYPHYLAYFNEAAGGPDQGWRYLLNSNLDWGQDLPGLAAYLKQRGISRVHLAYFGHADPSVYGISYDLPQKPSAPGLTAISANYLFGFPYPISYDGSWAVFPPQLAEPYRSRKPVAKIGYSIFLFED